MGRIMLVAPQRSGSGALGSVLDKHPKIAALGEVFHPANVGSDPNNFFKLVEEISGGATYHRHQAASERFFRSYVERLEEKCNKENILIDIKYSSLHHCAGHWRGLLIRPNLVHYAMKGDFKFIHLTRRNLIKTFISGILASQNKVWHAERGSEIEVREVVVGIRELCEYVSRADRENKLVAEWLIGSETISLVYEEMFDASGLISSDTSKKISKFLGVEEFSDTAPIYVKQAPKLLCQSITNFKAVEAALAGTKYEEMLYD